MSKVLATGKLPGKKMTDGPAVEKAKKFVDENNNDVAAPDKWKKWADNNADAFFDKVEGALEKATFRD